MLMCLNPVTIKNPNWYRYGNYAYEKGCAVKVPKHITPQSKYITVPCGKCEECRATYFNSILQRAIIESMSSYIYFITLTYDDQHIPCLELDGERFYYANYDHIQDMFKRFRINELLDRDFRYLTVNEYGDKKHRPHFHCLLFVAKKKSDNLNTPHEIRDLIYNNLGNYFAINKGTKKNPVYEKLFTFRQKLTKFGIKTNYYVKFVESNQFYQIVNDTDIQDVTNVKTIRYLIGYVNKPSKYEQKLEYVIDRYKDDELLHDKLKRLLRSKVRYSKGFGCGFTNGKKYYLQKISVRCSLNSIVYSELCDVLPDTYEEFCEFYPDMRNDLVDFLALKKYTTYKNWKDCLNSFSEHEYLCHCIYLKYFKKEFNSLYQSYKDNVKSTISYHYSYMHKGYMYDFQKVKTYEPENSPIFNYLRQGVEDGLAAGVPYLAFKMIGQQRFTALCKFYKDRICTVDDTVRLYAKLGVRNYEEWIELFNRQKKLNKAHVAAGNVLKYYNSDEVEHAKVQNITNSEQYYVKLFSNRNREIFENRPQTCL